MISKLVAKHVGKARQNKVAAVQRVLALVVSLAGTAMVLGFLPTGHLSPFKTVVAYYGLILCIAFTPQVFARDNNDAPPTITEAVLLEVVRVGGVSALYAAVAGTIFAIYVHQPVRWIGAVAAAAGVGVLARAVAKGGVSGIAYHLMAVIAAGMVFWGIVG